MTLDFSCSKAHLHHVYTDMITPLTNLDETGEAYPEKDFRKDKERNMLKHLSSILVMKKYG